jgi:hypothetical protein
MGYVKTFTPDGRVTGKQQQQPGREQGYNRGNEEIFEQCPGIDVAHEKTDAEYGFNKANKSIRHKSIHLSVRRSLLSKKGRESKGFMLSVYFPAECIVFENESITSTARR